jgi:hypothetical protein
MGTQGCAHSLSSAGTGLPIAMANHTYRYTPSRWLIFLGMGAFGVIVPFVTLAVNSPKLATGQLGSSGYLGLAVLFAILLPIGILMLATPFLAKIVVSPLGLEYHTLSAVIRFDWRETASLKGIEVRRAGKDLVLITQYTDITPRAWTRFMPWDVRRNLIGMPIPVSSFGGFQGRQLLDDIKHYVPDLLEAQAEGGSQT